MYYYQAVVPEIRQILEELREKESRRRLRLVEEFRAMGVRPVNMGLKPNAESIRRMLTDGPSMVGVPAPVDPGQETLPGWRRVSDRTQLNEDYLVPADGPDGDEARAFLAANQPADFRGHMLIYGVPRYVPSRKDRSRGYQPGFILAADATYIASMEPLALPSRYWAMADMAAAHAAEAEFGCGWKVEPALS